MRLLARSTMASCRRRVEHEALPDAVSCVQPVEEDGVDVRVCAQVTVGALDDGDGAVLAAGNAPFRQALAQVGRHRVDKDGR